MIQPFILDLTVCTYNMGSKITDFNLLKQWETGKKYRDDENEDLYQIAQDNTTSILLKEKIDVYCLQEVNSEKRPLIRGLVKKGYEIHHFATKKGFFDSAIVLNPSRFKDITNESVNLGSVDVAIVRAYDTKTQKIFRFVSAHISGYPLSNPQVGAQGVGDNEIKILQKILARPENDKTADYTVIGADMNTNPKLWEQRFEPLTTAGFQTFSPRKPTAVYPEDKKMPKRQIDFIFGKGTGILPSQSIFSKIKSIFFSTIATSYKTLLGFNSKVSQSDHLPFVVSFNKQQNSKIWDCFRMMGNFFANLMHSKASKSN